MSLRPRLRGAGATRAGGQSATELLVVLPVLVLLVFGIIQLGLMYQARATLNHATMLAARAGALHNGDHGEMRNALARGLAPLFASEASAAGYAEALAKATTETTTPIITTIEVLNPTGAALADFGRDRLDGAGGRELPNDTLHYRTTAAGATSHISVQDANLLHVRVTYCMRLIVPVIDRMLASAVNAVTPAGGAGAGAGMRNPFGIGPAPGAGAPCANPAGERRIPIRSEAILRMQSAFYEANLGGGGGAPPDTEVPVDPDEPGGPGGPGDPTDPEEPEQPGEPTC